MKLKRLVAKNPKSLLFAQLADLLRADSYGDEQKLDEALLTANKGLGANANFLPGRLARGRILMEKGDFAEAKKDFEAVAEQDPFCLSSQKLLLEISEKLGQPPKTEIYAKILGTLEPETQINIKPQTESASVNAALDSILNEEENTEKAIEETAEETEDAEICNLLLQTFDNIFEAGKQKDNELEILPYDLPNATGILEQAGSPPDINALIEEQLADKAENIPDLTDALNSLLEPEPSEPILEPALAASFKESPSVDLDALVKEQLADKAEDIPDLTDALNSLLESEPSEPILEPILEPALAASFKESPSVDLDALIKEQLADKAEDIPDLTEALDSLLASAPAPAEPVLEPYTPPVSQIDSLLAKKPTMTLAELYMDQGLPQKAAEIYKELLAQDPENEDLKTKLALAEIQT